ncbi:hypothetical protein FBU30_008245 [Linnemannia zychae]|nr:hypothetical protein FBU30_008245 [Linnemannia zychae]
MTSVPQQGSASSIGNNGHPVGLDEDLNFHDFIHAKHDDERYGDDSRISVVLPGPNNGSGTLATTTSANSTATTQSQLIQNGNQTQPIGDSLHITSQALDNFGNGSNSNLHDRRVEGSSTHSTGAHIGSLYDNPSDHFPPYDQVPLSTQDLFRTLMEELQTEAAHQRDQYLASSMSTSTSTRPDSGVEVDYSLGSHHHHSRPLPRFMMEPLDFLSGDYESCLGDSTDMHSAADTQSSDLSSFSKQYVSSCHDQNQSAAESSSSLHTPFDTHAPIERDRSGSFDTNSRKRPLAEDDNNNNSASPQSYSVAHDQQSQPTQDLFRMLMEELETQAALQRDQSLASISRQEVPGSDVTLSNTDYSAFNSNGHHHARLPRFVMEPLDFFNTDYGSIQVDSTMSDSGVSGVGSSTNNTSQMHPSTSPSLESNHSLHQQQQQQQQQEFAPPNLFRTLMEELETQAAFQRDQVLAATTGTAPRVDPDEYIFNGQHLRPLPRFMIEPFDFMSPSYESYLSSDISSGQQSFDPSKNNFWNLGQSATTLDQNNTQSLAPPAKKVVRRPSASGSKGSSGTKSRRPKPLTIAPRSGSNLEIPFTAGSSQLPSPSKRRRVGDDDDVGSGSCSPSSLVGSPLGSVAGDGQESPVSPISVSSMSISNDDQQGTEGLITEKTSALASKRPWTHKDEALLLKLFAKRLPIKEIAQTLDRSVHSVRSRRQILTDPGFVKGKGHSVSRRCKQDPTTTTKLPTYAQMAFLSLAWLPEMEGTLNDVATMVEKLFSKHLNRIPRTGHKNLQIWRAQISDALAHEKGQPRPRFESFGVKRGRQWVYRLTEFGKGVVDAMGGVDTICENLLKSNEMEMANAQGEDAEGSQDSGSKDADGVGIGGSGADAGIGQGQGYGYSYKPPDARQKTNKGSSRAARRNLAKQKAAAAAAAAAAGEPLPESGGNAITNAVEAIAAAMAKMMAFEDEKEKEDVKMEGGEK